VRWTGSKPKSTEQLTKESARELSLIMQAWRVEWQVLEKELEKLEADCSHIDVPIQIIPNVAEIRGQLLEQEGQ